MTAAPLGPCIDVEEQGKIYLKYNNMWLILCEIGVRNAFLETKWNTLVKKRKSTQMATKEYSYRKTVLQKCSSKH